MPDPEYCPHCQAARLEVILEGPDSPHYARLCCGECGRFLKWLPSPVARGGEPADDVVALVIPRAVPVRMVGTPAQIVAAIAIRRRLHHLCIDAGRPDLRRLLNCIRDSSWFLANRDETLTTIRWPMAKQMERPS